MPALLTQVVLSWLWSDHLGLLSVSKSGALLAPTPVPDCLLKTSTRMCRVPSTQAQDRRQGPPPTRVGWPRVPAPGEDAQPVWELRPAHQLLPSPTTETVGAELMAFVLSASLTSRVHPRPPP